LSLFTCAAAATGAGFGVPHQFVIAVVNILGLGFVPSRCRREKLPGTADPHVQVLVRLITVWYEICRFAR